MFCFACQSIMDPDADWCPKCGAAAWTRGSDRERQFVTILRADVVNSTGLVAELEPEEAIARLEPALAAMRGAVRQFGGIVSKELGDGLAAVFGAPIADDNHAPLACHAAIELVRRVASLGDPAAGPGGSALRLRDHLHGGQRVLQGLRGRRRRAASGRPAGGRRRGEPDLCIEACQKLADGHVRFEFLGRKSLRGFSEALPVYRVVGASDLSSWRVRRARSISRCFESYDGAGAAWTRCTERQPRPADRPADGRPRHRQVAARA